MTSSFRALGRLFAGASLLALPSLLLIPGCGGGGSGATPGLAFQRVVGVELLDNSGTGTPVVFDRGNLTVGIVDSSSPVRTASGTLQLLGSAAIVPTPTATVAGATPAPTPALPTGTINLRPTTASYLLTGTATYTGSSAPFDINMRGALKSDLPFTLLGNMQRGSIILLRAQTQSGSVIIPMRVVEIPFAFATVAPTPVVTSVPNATPVATPTGTATATGTPTATASATPVSPVGTPVSPVGTPVSPLGTPVSPTTPF